jgi:signal transduction histidine kinase
MAATEHREALQGALHGPLRVTAASLAVLSLGRALAASEAIPNYLPLLSIESVFSLLFIGLAIRPLTGRWVIHGAALSYLIALTLEIRLFFPFVFSLDVLLGGFLISTVFSVLLLVGLSAGRFSAISVLAFAAAGLSLWSFFEKVRGELPALFAAVVGVHVVVATLAHFLIRYRTERLRVLQLLQEKESLNRKLASAGAEMMEQRRQQSLASVAAGIAHEVNNPLNYAVGNLSFLRGDLKTVFAYVPEAVQDEERFRRARDELLEITDSLETGLTRISDVVGRLRAIFRGDPAATTRIRLRDVVDSCVESVRPQNSSRVSLDVDVPEDLELVANPADLHTVCSNVLKNAFEAVGAEGAVRIRAREHGDADEGGYVLLVIQDDGCGMPEETRARVLDPFFSTKRDHDGFGIGLSLAHTIIGNYGGTLQIESDPDVYTRVTITMPKEHSR